MVLRSPFCATHVRGIVFDLDGTLVDGYQGIASGVNAARASFGLPALTEDDVRGRVGLGLSNLMNEVVGPARAAEGAAIFRSVYDRVCVDQTRAVPALGDTLQALRVRGFRMSVASNKPAEYSIRILDRLGALPMFDTIEGPETAGALKPDPAMIRACLAAMNVPADAALYVGDMEIDAEAGVRAGIAVVLVSGGSTPQERLRDTGHPVLGTLRELLDLLPPAASAGEDRP
jgi:phosphoglycolate phosphatase